MDASFESLDVGLNWSTHRRQGTSKGSGEAFKRKMECGWHEERRSNTMGRINWDRKPGKVCRGRANTEDIEKPRGSLLL